MLIANSDGQRVTASRGVIASCPMCDEPVIAKCGELVRHHWAHKQTVECDSWDAHETSWHRGWKSRFPVDSCEVILTKNGVKHRADVICRGECVIEFQHSGISYSDIRKRESFYGKRMCWVWDCSAASEAGRLVLRDRGNYHTFRWVNPKKLPSTCRQPIFFDVGNGMILDVKRFYVDERTAGWGYLIPNEQFVDDMTLKNPRGWMDRLYRPPNNGYQVADYDVAASIAGLS